MTIIDITPTKIKPPAPLAFYGTRQRIVLKSWRVDKRLSVFAVEVHRHG